MSVEKRNKIGIMNVLRMYSILVVIYALEFDNVVDSRYMSEKRLNYLHHQCKHLFFPN